MKGVISIFAMPQELEDLALTLNMLKRNSVYITNNNELKVEITMCLSDELTDWDKSILPKQYIQERTIELCTKLLGWCKYELKIETESDILGCVSQRRFTLKNNPNADFYIWLDCDFFFKDITLYYILSAFEMIKDSGRKHFVITPQFVKQWDPTWDIIVNKNFMNKPYDYELISDVYVDTLPDLEPVNVEQLNGMKFAGGWFTLLSGDLVRDIGIPDSLGHYGLEDTFIIECSNIMNSKGGNVSQFILENLIIAESYTQRPNETIKKYISSKNRKQEFTNIANQNFQTEIKKFYENITTIN